MAGMIVIALIVLAAVYVIMRFLNRSTEGLEEGDKEPHTGAPEEASDEEFVESYIGPVLEDAQDSLDAAVESAKSGLYLYCRGSWEDASGEFHEAAKSIDGAAGRLREVLGMVEDPGSKPVREVKARIGYCLKLRAMASRMEEASDAMASGKEDEARKQALIKNELEQLISAYPQPSEK